MYPYRDSKKPPARRKTGEEDGFALYFHNFSTFLGRAGIYLEDLYVKPEYRGRGIGTALLARLPAIAVGRGCKRLEWSCLDWNEKSIGFYRSLGALTMSDWTVCRAAGDTLRCLEQIDTEAGGREDGTRLP